MAEKNVIKKCDSNHLISIHCVCVCVCVWQLPAFTAGGCSWYPVSWHQPTGYRSGDSQSTHWSYSSSQPSKCIRSNLWTMRVTVATQTSLGSMRSTASSFIPGRNPWLGTSWRRREERRAGGRSNRFIQVEENDWLSWSHDCYSHREHVFSFIALEHWFYKICEGLKRLLEQMNRKCFKNKTVLSSVSLLIKSNLYVTLLKRVTGAATDLLSFRYSNHLKGRFV